MKKIHALLIFGTRPEAIKMAPLALHLLKREEFSVTVAVTAQHREMLDQVLTAFRLRPDYDLDIMEDCQTLSAITANALRGLDDVLLREQPDIVLVHGDTTTSLAGALAAFYRRIPIGHVEAGLRTYDLTSPFPEEMNRVFVDRLSALYFAPTERSRENLLREGVDDERIFVTGNTAIDALKYTVREDFDSEILRWAEGSRLLLLTAHRRESLGAPMRSAFRAIRRALEEFPDVKMVYPVHLNPAVQKAAAEELGNHERVRLIPPLNVQEFHNLLKRSTLILTDSGGVQEEAPALGKPVLVLRDTTERPEGVAAGTLHVVGTDEEKVFREIGRLLRDKDAYDRMSRARNPYGDGNAARRIADAILATATREEW